MLSKDDFKGMNDSFLRTTMFCNGRSKVMLTRLLDRDVNSIFEEITESYYGQPVTMDKVYSLKELLDNPQLIPEGNLQGFMNWEFRYLNESSKA